MPEQPLAHFVKDPYAVLTYGVDWNANWLDDGVTISSYTVTVPAGITKDSDAEAQGVVSCTLSGGTAGTTYTVVVHITDSNGNQDDRSFEVYVSER